MSKLVPFRWEISHIMPGLYERIFLARKWLILVSLNFENNLHFVQVFHFRFIGCETFSKFRYFCSCLSIQFHSETKNNVIPSRWYNSMTAAYMRENHPTGMRSQPTSGGLLISDSIFKRNVVIWESTKFRQRRIYWKQVNKKHAGIPGRLFANLVPTGFYLFDIRASIFFLAVLISQRPKPLGRRLIICHF